MDLKHVTLPPLPPGARWSRLVDTSLSSGEDVVLPGSEVPLDPPGFYLVMMGARYVVSRTSPRFFNPASCVPDTHFRHSKSADPRSDAATPRRPDRRPPPSHGQEEACPAGLPGMPPPSSAGDMLFLMTHSHPLRAPATMRHGPRRTPKAFRSSVYPSTTERNFLSLLDFGLIQNQFQLFCWQVFAGHTSQEGA